VRQSLATILLTLSLGTSAAYAQSLAEAARQAEAARKDDKTKSPPTSSEAAKPGGERKVYTDKDLGGTPAVESEAPEIKGEHPDTAAKSGATAADATSTSTDAPKKDDPQKDEAYWRGRLTPLHAKLRDEQDKLVSLNRRIRELTAELAGIGPLNARRAGVESERQHLITESDDVRASINADRAAIETIEEEGRRAGALPGWFR
jgi:hypothetical protein